MGLRIGFWEPICKVLVCSFFRTLLRLDLNIGIGPYVLPPDIGTAKLDIVGDPNSIRLWDDINMSGQPCMGPDITSLAWDLTMEPWLSPLYVQGVQTGSVQIVFRFEYAGRTYVDKVTVTSEQ